MSHRKRKPRRTPRPAQDSIFPNDVQACADDACDSQAAPGAQPAGDVGGAATLLVAPDAEPEAAQAVAVAVGEDAVAIGERLRRARTALDIDITDAGRRLKLPHRVLQKLERGDWSGIDSPLYLRGYLRSYSNLLGIETPEIEPATSTLPVTPPLVSTGGIPRSHYLLQRYTTAATYLGLTALVVVPIVLLGLHGGLQKDLTRLVPLDPPAQDAPASRVADGASVRQSIRIASPANNGGEDGAPLMASMAPVALLDRELEKRPLPEVPPPPPVGGHSIDLHLDAPSWVEIHAADGSRIEYALLEQGDHHYSAAGEIDVRLGNSQNARLRVDGQARDLDAYRRANVAHFRVDDEGSVQPPRG